jgi:hypothetical protein
VLLWLLLWLPRFFRLSCQQRPRNAATQAHSVQDLWRQSTRCSACSGASSPPVLPDARGEKKVAAEAAAAAGVEGGGAADGGGGWGWGACGGAANGGGGGALAAAAAAATSAAAAAPSSPSTR